MLTDCCECDRPAFRFWGQAAYCGRCFDEAVAADPKAHQCPKCHAEQPRHVMWRGDAPCGVCQEGGHFDYAELMQS